MPINSGSNILLWFVKKNRNRLGAYTACVIKKPWGAFREGITLCAHSEDYYYSDNWPNCAIQFYTECSNREARKHR